MIARVAPWLRRVDPHVLAGIASMGLATGSWVAAAYALVQLLSDPRYLVELYVAIQHWHRGALGNADVYVIAQLVGALVALFGTAVIAMVLALYGRAPSLRRSPVPAEGGASSPHTD